MSMITSALLEALGMFSENQETPGKFTKKDFESLIDKYGLSHNHVIAAWNDIWRY